MTKIIDINNACVNASNIQHAISALERFSYERIQKGSVQVDDINELNGLIASIHCLAVKHADELEQYSMECD